MAKMLNYLAIHLKTYTRVEKNCPSFLKIVNANGCWLVASGDLSVTSSGTGKLASH
jgi:hypothetical protein